MNQNLLMDQAAIMPLIVEGGPFESLATIQAPTKQSGAPSGVYVAVTGLIALPCNDSAESDLSATEAKALSETASLEYRTIRFSTYYPLLNPTTLWGSIGWRVVVTGQDGGVVTYDILGAISDSLQTQTRLKVRKVSV